MPMTTAEIKALVAETKQALSEFDPPLAPHAQPYRLIAAIETMLAREAEVMGVVPDKPLNHPQNPNETELAIWRERNEIRRRINAILNPENET